MHKTEFYKLLKKARYYDVSMIRVVNKIIPLIQKNITKNSTKYYRRRTLYDF